MRTALLAALVCAIAASHATAESAFTGKDAAHIDWGVRNCAAVITDKERKLVDEANTKAKAQFVEQWTAESNKLIAAADSQSKQQALCASIKDWYGPLGSRIAGLVSWNKEASSDTKSASSTQPSAGRKGRKRSGQ
jgi:hypothetical protein